MIWSGDSSVGIATGYGLDDQGGGSSSPGRVNNFHFSISSRPALRSTQPPIKWVPGASLLFHTSIHLCGDLNFIPLLFTGKLLCKNTAVMQGKLPPNLFSHDIIFKHPVALIYHSGLEYCL
jgi:hypothetical protein